MARKDHDFGRVAVLMGGTSGEREISLQTGANVLAGLKRLGINAFGIDVKGAISEQLCAQPIDRAFLALHGRGGEDGSIQGMLELLGIPYTGSGVMGSAVSMNKQLTKTVWRANAIPTADSLTVTDQTDQDELIERFGLPLCIKPIEDGSTLGVTKVKSKEQLPAAIAEASRFHGGVMAESWVEGREFTVGVLGRDVLPLIEIITQREFYDYQAKYEVDDNQYLTPTDLPDALVDDIKALSLKAFEVTGCSGWGRLDFILDANNQPWFIEVNTIPGMTEHSLVPKAAKAIGMEFDEVLLRILQESL